MMDTHPAQRSRHLVDPELLPLVDAFPHIPLSDETLAAFRNRQLPAALLSDGAKRVEREVLMVPGGSGTPDVKIATYRPSANTDPLPVVLHIHGGGFVGGNVDSLEARHRELAAVLQCYFVSVDYRLAPETKHPGALNDCYAALAWVVAQSTRLGIRHDTIALMGESAGGGLAAGLALLARDRQEYSPCFQHLIYPMLDDRTAFGLNKSAMAGEFLWTPNDNLYGWTAMLGASAGGADVSAYAAPSRAEALGGLPPTFLMTGALDLFAVEGVSYARRLMEAGVPVEAHIFPGAFHGFDLATWTSVGKRAREASIAALYRALHGEPTDN